jgi:hypothetical protein
MCSAQQIAINWRTDDQEADGRSTNFWQNFQERPPGWRRRLGTPQYNYNNLNRFLTEEEIRSF